MRFIVRLPFFGILMGALWLLYKAAELQNMGATAFMACICLFLWLVWDTDDKENPR